jgi:hypothetical protein
MRLLAILLFVTALFGCNTSSLSKAYQSYSNAKQNYIKAILDDNKKLKINSLKEIIKCGSFLGFNVSKYKKELYNLGYKIPLAWERGYHHHFSTKKDIDLSPAIHDVDGGFVYSCNKNEIRVTSGVELNFREADLNEEQIKKLLKSYTDIIHSDIPTIEKYGGGSARCMLTELF